MSAVIEALWRAARRHGKGLLEEGRVHARWSRDPPGAPRVMVFPSNDPWDPASNLRAWLIAPELRALGWGVTTVSPALNLAQRRRVIRVQRPDVILMQQTRHALNHPKLYAPVPVVLDADDADCLDPRHSERIAESARDAAAVVGGSRFVAGWLGAHNPRASVIWTCTPAPSRPPATPIRARPPIVAWAHATPFAYRQEAALVQEALSLAADRARFAFWLFGTTEDEARSWFAPLRAKGVDCLAVAKLGYQQYLDKVAACAIGLQPVCVSNHAFSRGKSFGKVLAYLSGSVAVIASDEVDHPLFFRHRENGMLAGEAAAEWADCIVELAADRELRGAVGERGHQDFLARLTTPTFARLLDPILRGAKRAAGADRATPAARR